MRDDAARAEEVVARFFVQLWIDRGRMPDEQAKEYLLDALTTFAAQAAQLATQDVLAQLEPAEEGAMVRVNTKNACPSDVAVVGALYVLRARHPAAGRGEG